ncbi:MAG TPA: pyridoxamine 5'-phosphate oxidase family protein [Planctomycetota bacterium]|nr:pyridoxamine 5'-phosphate oxidase family protein [Planctomycetota bacterium]
MKDVKAFMKEVGWGTLGTTDGEKVGVRPMGGWVWVERELWCASQKPSDKVAQLEAVPYAEYCFSNPKGRHVRIAGPCAVSTNPDDKQKLYDLVPGLKKHIEDPAAPGWAVLRMTPDRVRAMTPEMTYEDIPLD